MKRWLKIFYWFLVLFTLYIAYETIRKLVGGSLGFEEIVVGLLIANLGHSFYLNSLISEHLGWHRAQRSKT